MIKAIIAGNSKSALIDDEAEPLVQEFFTRKAMAGLGITSDMKCLPAWKVDCFAYLSLCIAEQQEKELKKKLKK